MRQRDRETGRDRDRETETETETDREGWKEEGSGGRDKGTQVQTDPYKPGDSQMGTHTHRQKSYQ